MSTRRSSIGSSQLEYAAEVAYIVATSPPAGDPQNEEEDEFAFSFSETRLRSLQKQDEASEARAGERVSVEREVSPATTAVEETDSATVAPPRKISSTSTSDSFCTTPSSDSAATPTGETQRTLVVYGRTNYPPGHLVSRLVQSNPSLFSRVVPHTTRSRRGSELDGVDFHFVDRKSMSGELKKGNFLESVKISSPKLKPKRTASFGQETEGESQPSPPLTGSAVNPWKKDVVQVPSPLLTPKSSRQRSKSSGKSSDLYGTSREAVRKARLQGKPCVVLGVTHKGAQQLKRGGCEAVYILLDTGGEEGTDAADVPEDGGSLQPDHHIAAQTMEQAFLDLQRIAFQTVSSLPLSPRSKVDITRDEWESLPTVEMERLPSHASSPVSKSRLLTFTDLLVHYQRERIGKKPTKTSKKSPTSLSKSLRDEYDLVQCLSKTPLSDTEPLHIEALQTVYQKLMGSSLNCRRYGPHWQDIGFHSVDPGESLNEVGFFGVMQLVSFLEHSLPLAMEIFGHSREGSHQFPFAVVSISLTEAALKSLREGYLVKLCNKLEQVIVTLNNYHSALFYRFYHLWRSQNSHTQVLPVIKEAAKFARKHPKSAISDVVAYLQSGKDEHELAPVRKISHSLSNPFTPFPRLTDRQEELQPPSS